MAAWPVLQTGDVVWAPDPYHDDDPDLARGAGRPWLVVSTSAYPNQGADYICCALTTSRRAGRGLVALGPGDWEFGGPSKPSKVDPRTILTLKHRWVDRRVGRLSPAKVARVRASIRSYL